MKRIMLVSLLVSTLVSVSFALQSGSVPYGVGAKYAGMGGAASAIVDDITCAYFNPAGIVKTGKMELKIGAGTATDGMNELLNVISQASDPAQILANNYNKVLNINGGFNGIVGLNIAKVGLSVIPIASLRITKPTAGSILGSSLIANGGYEGALTLGYSLSIPGIPIASFDLGTNLKTITSVTGSSVINSATQSTDTVTSYSGVGFDIGAKASINTLAVPVSVALVLKDIGETLNGKTKTITTTYDITGNITNQTQAEVDAPAMTNPTTLVIGAATVIPAVGLKVAADIDSVSGSGTSYTVTHLGVEYPVLGVMALRAGMISGGPGGSSISMTTLGAGFNLGLGLNVATMMDANNSKNNSTIVDLGFAF
ncbi:MAG: hypothetical protein KJ732_05600 [Candidatus Margulisbacteria bacterium]|nr:hypothetical protein [Candidatus Margulisiibacteriota bacterium]